MINEKKKQEVLKAIHKEMEKEHVKKRSQLITFLCEKFDYEYASANNLLTDLFPGGVNKKIEEAKQ